jgi:FixJ family two-component response regulator
MSDTPPFIYVVDDDPSVALGLSRLLRSWGMQVRTFGSGAEFLSALNEPPDPDCCVLDVQMPGMTGMEVQENLNRSGRDLPVIFITAHYDGGIEWQALKAGAVGFLRKPFSDEVLVCLIRKALQGRRQLKPCEGVDTA